jgi:hypothetical protein
VAVGDLPHLGEGGGHAVAGHKREVADAAEVEAFVLRGTFHDFNPLRAVAEDRDRAAGQERLERLRNLLWSRPSARARS